MYELAAVLLSTLTLIFIYMACENISGLSGDRNLPLFFINIMVAFLLVLETISLCTPRIFTITRMPPPNL